MNVFQILRNVRKLSVDDVAKKLSVSTDCINSIECGEVFPSDEMLTDYADVLDVSKDVLVTFCHECNKDRFFKNVMLRLLQTIMYIEE